MPPALIASLMFFVLLGWAIRRLDGRWHRRHCPACFHRLPVTFIQVDHNGYPIPGDGDPDPLAFCTDHKLQMGRIRRLEDELDFQIRRDAYEAKWDWPGV